MRAIGCMALVVLFVMGCESGSKKEASGDAGPPDLRASGGSTGGSTSATVATAGGTGSTGPIATAGVPNTSAGQTSSGTGTSTGGQTSPDAGVKDAAVAKDSVTKDAVAKDSVAKDSITKDAGTSDSSAGSGDTGNTDAGSQWNAANIYASCSLDLPANAQAVDTSKPSSVIGDGSPASCTFEKLQAATKAAGIITFNCGEAPVTIPVTATLELSITKDTVFDGGRRITLDGGGAVRIMRFAGTDFQKNNTTITLQHIALVNGKATPTEEIPTRPAPCSQGYNDGEGGAVFMRDGNLVVIDSILSNNQAALLGPDTGGGALYVLGSKNGLLIVGSTFTGNSASNAGAVGCLQSSLQIYNSLFQNNKATGRDANTDDESKCSYINNNQHEVGSGGNGGAIYSDGQSRDLMVCGTHVLNNAAGANAFGGGLFFTSNDFGGVLSLIDTTMTGNTGGSWAQVKSGTVTNVGTAIGTNAKSITVQNSNLQGMK